LGDGEIAALMNAIDEILEISAYYINLFRCYTLTIAYLNKSMSDEDFAEGTGRAWGGLGEDHGYRRITGGNAGVRPGSAREKISACRKPLGASGLS
jgi:hypothetical protein